MRLQLFQFAPSILPIMAKLPMDELVDLFFRRKLVAILLLEFLIQY